MYDVSNKMLSKYAAKVNLFRPIYFHIKYESNFDLYKAF